MKKGIGQTVLITGGSEGMGADLAECFARDGYDLILVARTQSKLADIAERLERTYGVRVISVAADLGIAGSGTKLAEHIEGLKLHVDVLVNNAGYGHFGAFAESDLPSQLGIVDLNIRGLVELTHLYLASMIDRRRGGILNVASTAAFLPGPFMSIYYASKAFVLSFTEALWEEARGSGLKVSCLCPGPTASRFRERAGTAETRLARNGQVMASAEVARQGYEGFQKNLRVVVPGKRNALMALPVPYVPGFAALRIVRNMLSPTPVSG